MGVYLQIQGTTLQDLWLARTIIEPPAAGLLAARSDPAALAELEANIAAEREAMREDLMRYAGLSAEFSMLITRHCGNKTIHLLASLIFDIIRRQHENIAERTLGKARVNELREDSIRSRQKAVDLMRRGTPAAAEKFWRAHLEHIRDLILAAYKAPMTIDLLSEPIGKLRPVSKVKRNAHPAPLPQ